MAWAKRARKAETPKQPSLGLNVARAVFLPDSFGTLRENLLLADPNAVQDAIE